MADTSVMDLPDGRELAWSEVGHKRGPVVFAFHGTPGSRLQMVFDQKSISASGVRLIAPDRPGYGHSTYHKGRTFSDWASDVVALADHLKVPQFAVVGVSGGGPHALACARYCGDRVSTVGLVAGVGPMADPRAAEAMVGPNRVISRLSAVSQNLSFPMFALITFVSRRFPDAALRQAGKKFAPEDAALLEREEVRAAFIDDARRASPTTAKASAQDFNLFATDWGFRLEDITSPAHIWHGDTDRNVPIAHGRLQADLIPGAILHEHPGEGHLLTIDHMEEILTTVSQG